MSDEGAKIDGPWNYGKKEKHGSGRIRSDPSPVAIRIVPIEIRSKISLKI